MSTCILHCTYTPGHKMARSWHTKYNVHTCMDTCTCYSQHTCTCTVCVSSNTLYTVHVHVHVKHTEPYHTHTHTHIHTYTHTRVHIHAQVHGIYSQHVRQVQCSDSMHMWCHTLPCSTEGAQVLGSSSSHMEKGAANYSHSLGESLDSSSPLTVTSWSPTFTCRKQNH